MDGFYGECVAVWIYCSWCEGGLCCFKFYGLKDVGLKMCEACDKLFF